MRNLPGRLVGVLRRLRQGARKAAPSAQLTLDLTVAQELDVLPHIEDIAQAFAPPHPQGAVATLAMPAQITDAEMRGWMAGRTAGDGAPEWHEGAGGALVYGVNVIRVREALHTPAFGAVIDRDGHVLKASVGEALYLTPSLAGLPHVTMIDDKPVMTTPAGVPRLEAGGVFMAWGGRFNYGHFLLDCLTSLAALKLTGMLDDMPPIAPPLTAWQREGVRLLLGEADAEKLIEVHAPLVSLGDVVFSTTMDHFLHAPNKPLDWVRERMLANIADHPDTGLRRIYLSRRGDEKRLMINEAQLEKALLARGFTVVKPEALPVAAQVALFRDADVVVAPTGAALANILFCRPGAKIFEIQPSNFTGIWTRGVAHFVGAAWHCFFAPSPISERDIVIEGALRPGTEFQWKTPLSPFLEFLDARL